MLSKRVRKSVKDTYRDFAENTSVHGTQNTIDGTPFTRFIWTVIVLSALGVSVYMLLLIWWRFTSGPTITYVDTATAPTYNLPFPAVTICNNNKIMPDKLEQFVDTLNLNGRSKDEVLEAIPQILPMAINSYLNMNTSSSTWLPQLLKLNGYSEYETFLKITQTCEELLLRCKWEGIVTNCNDLFVNVFTVAGRCCAFNLNLWDNGTTRRTEYFGHHMGLIVVTNNTKIESKYNYVTFLGITVIIHNSLEIPRGAHRSFSTGTLMFIQIFGTRLQDMENVKTLPQKQRNCYYNNETKERYFPLHSDTNCNTGCQIKKYYEKCQCVPYGYKISGMPICGFGQLKCLRETVSSKDFGNCDCPNQCEGVIYNILSSGSNLVNENTAISSFLKGLDTSSSSLINVFYPYETYTHIKRSLVTDDLYILSSLGGIFGLLLGCSFTSVAEMLYEILIRFMINLKILNKVKEVEQINWVNKPRDIYYDKKAFYN